MKSLQKAVFIIEGWISWKTILETTENLSPTNECITALYLIKCKECGKGSYRQGQQKGWGGHKLNCGCKNEQWNNKQW